MNPINVTSVARVILMKAECYHKLGVSEVGFDMQVVCDLEIKIVLAKRGISRVIQTNLARRTIRVSL